MRISLIQSALVWEQPSANYMHFENIICQLKFKTDLVILPELFNSGFSMRTECFAEQEQGFGLNWLKRLASQNHVVIMGSLATKTALGIKNRLHIVLPDETCFFYDKKHLFRMGHEHLHYSPGSLQTVFTFMDFQIMGLICYDLRFPVWSRNHLKKDAFKYDVLVYVANWPERRHYAWKHLLIARAIENQAYVIGVNRIGTDGNNIAHAGESMLIDPNGQILLNCGLHNATVMTATLDKSMLQILRNEFPVGKDADAFTLDNPN